MANFNLNQTVVGLGTTTVTVPTTDRYTISAKIQLPRVSAGSTKSQVVAVVNKNGSPIYTGDAGAQGLQISPFLAANDVITVVLTSAAPTDAGLNRIKMTLSVSEGV